MLELIMAVGFAVIVSAGCSLFEAVLYSVPLRHIETMISKGKQSAKIFRSLRRDVERPITAILSLNTIANTAGVILRSSTACSAARAVRAATGSRLSKVAYHPSCRGSIPARQHTSTGHAGGK